MLVEEMRDRLGGLYVLTVTPFKDNFDIDLEGMRENVRFLLENGITSEVGILVPGAGYGEGVYLSLEEHRRLVKAVLDEVQGKISVFPGVHLNGTLEAAKYCKQLQDMGADGVQLSPPAAYAMPTDDDIVYHYRQVAKAAPKLGIIVYNTYWEWGEPSYRDMTPNLIGRLLEIKNVVGIKWSSKTLSNFVACLDEYAEKCAFFNNMGAEVLPLFYMLGGRGFCVSEFAPWYNLKLKSLLEERNYADVWEELKKWAFPFSRLMKEIMSEGKHWIAISKALVEISGLNAGPPRPPQIPVTSDQYERIRNLVEETGILSK